MRWTKWAGLAAAIALILSCFFTWIIIPGKNIVVTGIDSTGTYFGKPGYLTLIFATIFLILHLTPRIWAKRLNVIVSAFNLAWAIRNYYLMSTCRAGDCPDVQIALYVVLGSSILLLIASLFPDIKLKEPGK